MVCLDLGSGVGGHLLGLLHHFLVLEAAPVAYVFVSVLGGYFELADVAQTGQSLASEAKRSDGVKIAEICDFGGGKSFAEEWEISLSDSLSVVYYFDAG